MAMDAGVPVKTAKENRMKVLGAADILWPRHHVIELVGIFLVHMPQGDGGQLGRKVSR
jgi:hypothetical protein